MQFAGNVFVVLNPVMPAVPYDRLLARWESVGFDPVASQAALESFIAEHRLAPGLFEPAAIRRGERPATDALLYDGFAGDRPWTWVLATPERTLLRATVSSATVPALAGLLRTAARAPSAADFADAATAVVGRKAAEVMASALTQDAPHGRWPLPEAPGIYRREHASLLIRSATTAVLLDPQSLQRGWTTNDSRSPAQPEGARVDAVAITHGHNDHWHLPSVLFHARDERVPVLVPDVPRASLLSEEVFSASLALARQEARTPAWYETVTVGDIVIDVLPFFGEQPTRHAPGPEPVLRNWGNCYRFTCPDFSALVLVDSGDDPAGALVDAVRRSVETRGPVDVVLSCCLDFAEGINPGLPHYALALPFERLRQMHRARAHAAPLSMTAGVSGVAQACEVARATTFLPYAHGFSGIGQEPRGEGSPVSETTLCESLRTTLTERGVPTQIQTWRPGDGALFRTGTLRMHCQ